MAEVLTKKQQKAQAFKSKQKSKRRGDNEVEQPDVPEQDLLDDDAEEEKVEPKKVEKKEKVEKKVEKTEKEVVDAGAEESEKKKGKRKKTAWDDEEEEEEGEKVAKKSKKDIQQRFILFVGNLGFKTTKDRIEAVFRQALGETPSVRLLTNKAKPGSTMGPTSRGIAFLEFSNAKLLQEALKLHHTDLDGRRINVELTVGGGGSGTARKEKLDARKGRMTEQRDRKAEKEKEEGGEQAGSASVGGGDGEVKMRGGRRIKPKTDGPPRGDGYSRGGGGGGGRGGGGRGGGRGGASFPRGGGGGRGGGYSSAPRGRKWEPTGANAVSVG